MNNDQEKIEKIVNDKSTSKSEKMRQLTKFNLTTNMIAKLVKVRYQFVNNVLTRSQLKSKPANSDGSLKIV